MPSGPVRPVRPCLVRPLGLCPMAGLWRLFLVWPGGALTRPYAVWAFNQGPGSNRASVALAWVDPPSGPILAPYGGMVSFYLQPGPGATEPQLHWPGLTPLLGPSWRHMGAWFPFIFNRGPGSNRASVALAWVDPPSGPILAPYGGMVSFYLQPGPREQQSLSRTGLG